MNGQGSRVRLLAECSPIFSRLDDADVCPPKQRSYCKVLFRWHAMPIRQKAHSLLCYPMSSIENLLLLYPCSLFDRPVKPVLSYGCEVWGVDCGCQVQEHLEARRGRDKEEHSRRPGATSQEVCQKGAGNQCQHPGRNCFGGSGERSAGVFQAEADPEIGCALCRSTD
jgi:hypothetical protein